MNGGYFSNDPRTWRDGTQMNDNALVIAYTPEQYIDQEDWEANSSDYSWRVKQKEEEMTALIPPVSLTEIGESAFENCGASVAYIPDQCTTIGPNAFKDCGNLRAVHIPGSVTVIEETAFDGCSTGMYIYGERGSAAETFCDNHPLHFRDENAE